MKLTVLLVITVVGLIGWAAIFIALAVGPAALLHLLEEWSMR